MNDDSVNATNCQYFSEGSINLRLKFYKPDDILFQNTPVEEKKGEIKNVRLGKGTETDTLIRVDFQGIVKLGGKVIESFEGITVKENLKKSPSKKFVEKMFESGLKNKEESNIVKQTLLKYTDYGIFGRTAGKLFDFVHKCVTEVRMEKNMIIEILNVGKSGIFTIKQNLHKMMKLMMTEL